MKRVLVKSVFDAFDYVLEHYYPYGLEEFAQRSDRYAVISIQDSHTGGFGFRFEENRFCDGVLTLQFDDIDRPVPGAVLFSPEQARRILDFVREHRQTETLLVHCYAGQSRSRAVGAAAARLLGGAFPEKVPVDNANPYVLKVLLEELAAQKELQSEAACAD